MKAIAIGAFMVVATTTAGGAEDTASASYRLRYCKIMTANSASPLDFQSSFQAGICAGTIAGIATMGHLIRLGPAAAQLRAAGCLDIPQAATLEQQIRVVVAYIEARPARMHERFDGLAIEALAVAWPCPGGKK
jgi:hypothetical protein